MPFFHTAGPNTALIKSTGEVVVAGRTFVIPILQRVDKLSLSLRTLTVRTERGTCVNGVGVDVTSCCQVKVRAWVAAQEKEGEKLKLDKAAVQLAAQHFIGKSDAEINDTISKTIAGHQRAIIGNLTVEELYRDRQAFSRRVWDHCEDDMRHMGLAVVSYTVAEITDDHGYIEALGVRQTEKVKRTAEEGAARHQEAARSVKAERDAVAYMRVNEENERIIASDRLREVKRAEAQREFERYRAVQEKAYGISEAEQDAVLLVAKQKVKAEETEAERVVIGFKVEKERLVKEETVNVNADAQLYKARVDADARSAMAHANADREMVLAEAEAVAIREKGKAENEKLKARMKVWKDCGNEAAILERLLDVLPDIVAASTAPLEQTEKMVFVNSGDDSGHTRKVPPELELVATELQESLTALTGTDMSEGVKAILGNEAIQAAVGTSIGNKSVTKVQAKSKT